MKKLDYLVGSLVIFLIVFAFVNSYHGLCGRYHLWEQPPFVPMTYDRGIPIPTHCPNNSPGNFLPDAITLTSLVLLIYVGIRFLSTRKAGKNKSL